MAFKFIVLAAFVAAARAGDLGYAAAPALAYSSAPAVSYSNIHTPAVAYNAPAVAKIAAPVSYAAPLSYSAPVSYAAPAPVAYHAPAPVAYHAPAPVAYAAPVAKTVVAEQYAPAQYDFGYSVSDPHTGDSKSQQESRHGDVVQGSYSLVDADGTKRTVEYTADPHNGFNAVVHKEPLSAPVVAKVAAPVAYAAPAPVVAKYTAAPAVTVAKYAAATPLAYAAAAQPAYYH